MEKIITVAGATGNLGGRIISTLIERGTTVHAVVRKTADPLTLAVLRNKGVKVFVVHEWNVNEVAAACQGASCVVSAMAGLGDVIIDAQNVLLHAAVAARIPRFIPSDYCLDYTPFTDGENRNLDQRRAFQQIIEKAPIAATSIFNGAFMELLTGDMPMIFFKKKLVLHWGDESHPLIFTSIDDTATYTAYAALDDSAPRFLRIAGDQMNPKQIRTLVGDITGERFRLLRAGGPGLLSFLIKMVRKFSPSENELYPAWQGMQYMRNMIDKRSLLVKTNNDRYPEMRWTTIRAMLTNHYIDSKR
jgi:nucleoside-diphosphate-sugar epimerase